MKTEGPTLTTEYEWWLGEADGTAIVERDNSGFKCSGSSNGSSKGGSAKIGSGANAATAKTGGSTAKSSPGSSGGSQSGNGGRGDRAIAKKPMRTTAAWEVKKTVYRGHDENNLEMSCKNSLKGNKKTGIIQRKNAKEDEETGDAETEKSDNSRSPSPVAVTGYVPSAASYMPASAEAVAGLSEAASNQSFLSEGPQAHEADKADYQPAPAPDSVAQAQPAAEQADAEPAGGFQPASTDATGLLPMAEAYQPNTAYPSGFQPNARSATFSEHVPSKVQPSAARLF
ncbi:hypothetical protein CspeluHIS016_0202160 [Cutaneotrichosporon spelunceum]|uniref:Uncharacterized protein n=1 Tax=Cutaneotrichosporon spelunceum TaxID=1672016 RepID=A0AAD3Y9N2_9TREE|nr:hypothetical protein CspeluHIS016_0202160 [Cutaneotrichosporon spelunceum]